MDRMWEVGDAEKGREGKLGLVCEVKQINEKEKKIKEQVHK